MTVVEPARQSWRRGARPERGEQLQRADRPGDAEDDEPRRDDDRERPRADRGRDLQGARSEAGHELGDDRGGHHGPAKQATDADEHQSNEPAADEREAVGGGQVRGRDDDPHRTYPHGRAREGR